MKVIDKEIMFSQTRYLLLTILGNCVRNRKILDIKPLLKILRITGQKDWRKLATRCLKIKSQFLTEEAWYSFVIWKLSIDTQEINSLCRKII